MLKKSLSQRQAGAKNKTAYKAVPSRIYQYTHITWIYDKISGFLVFVHCKSRNVLVMNTQGGNTA